MTQRFVCEATRKGQTGAMGARRWPLDATNEHAAMEEMSALYEAEWTKLDTGTGLGWDCFTLTHATESEWQELRDNLDRQAPAPG